MASISRNKAESQVGNSFHTSERNFESGEIRGFTPHYNDLWIDPINGGGSGDLSSLSSRFTPSQWADLTQGSGLKPETIHKAGIYTVLPRDINRIVGGWLGSKVNSALAFPYNHGSNFIRYKLFSTTPITDKRGHRIKYFQPRDSKPALYIPPETKGLDDTNTPLWILEGEKKTLRWWQEGFKCSVGISGAWNWSNSYSLYPKLIEDFDKIKLHGRVVNVVVDSDYLTNRNVQFGYVQFANALLRAGAKVYFIIVPPGKDGQKAGLDDFLQSSHHTVKDVLHLPRAKITLDVLRGFEKELPRLEPANNFLRDVLNGADPDTPPPEDIYSEPTPSTVFQKIPMAIKSLLELFGNPEHNCQFFKDKTNLYVQGNDAWYEGGHPEHTVKCPACAKQKAEAILKDLFHNFPLGFYYLLMPNKASHASLRDRILYECKKCGIIRLGARLVSGQRSKKIIFSPVLVDPRMRFVTWDDQEMVDLLLPFLECDPNWKKGEHQFDGWGDFERYEKRIKERSRKMKGIIHLQLNCSPEKLTGDLIKRGEKPVQEGGIWKVKLSPSTRELIERIVFPNHDPQPHGRHKRLKTLDNVWSGAKVLNDGLAN